MIPILVSKDFDMFQLYSSENEPINDTSGAPIYVLNSNPTLPDNNAEGRLTDAISCTVTQELNGMYELEMEYPLDGVNYDNIGIRDVILARPNKDAALQPFRIYKITKPLDGIITVYARHLVYDLKGIVVKPFKATGIQESLSAIKTNSMTFNPFTFRSSKTSGTEFEVTKPTEIWELLTSNEGSLLDVYGGELTFNNYQIGIDDHIGMDRGVSVKYGLNMTELEQEEDYADCYTSVVGFYKDDETCIYGNIINSSVPFERVKVLPVDFSEYFDRETKPTKAQIDELARTYVEANQIGLPNLNWKINFVALDDTVEYQYLATSQYVGLGDTVTVKYTALGVDAKARAIAIEWNVLEDKHISISLGSVKNTLTSRLASNSRAISQAPNREEVASISSEVSQKLTQTILGAKGGSARFIDENNDGFPDTLYIADNDDPSRARKVWRFNYEGWAASSNGYEGPFELGATLDDGIIANFITTGTLSANLIRGGTLRLGGIDNTSGSMDLYDNIGDFFGKLSNIGLWLGTDDYSTYLTKSGLQIRRVVSGSPHYLIRLSADYFSADAPTSMGILELYSVDSDGNASLNCTIHGDGTISCKRLFVNGQEITPNQP